MLYLTISPNLDRAITSLAAHMPPGGPATVLQPWHVVVAGSSIQRIVSQHLSHVLGADGSGVASGVSANIQLVHPAWLNTLIRPVVRGEDEWQLQRMTWRLMGLAANPGVRRWRMARRVADDLDRSQLWRPDVVGQWLTQPPMAKDARPALSTDLAEMMAYLRGQHHQPTLVEQATEVIAAIRAGGDGLDPTKVHPTRPLMLFGVNNLPVLTLSVLAAYARDHDVYWWVTTPMTAIAQRVLGDLPDPDTVQLDASGTFLVRDDRITLDVATYAHTAFTQANGRETIEGLCGVASVAALAGAEITFLPTSSCGEGVGVTKARTDTAGAQGNPGTLPAGGTDGVADLAGGTAGADRAHDPADSVLTVVQRAIRTDTDQMPLTQISPADQGATPSLVRVGCARPQRQVEALRDYLFNAFMDDPTLEPRDVIVACPDPHMWAAPVRRAFAPGAGRPNLRVRLIDPFARIENPVRDVLERVLSLVDGQLTRVQLMQLAAMGPVAAKFGFDEQAIQDLGALLAATHMTWGLDPQDRERFGLPTYHGGTLQDSIDQLALGLARTEGGLGDLPAFGIKPNHIDMVGRFLAFVDVVRTAITRARQPMGISTGWVPFMTWLTEALCWVDFDHGWQITSVLRELNRLGEYAVNGPDDVPNREFGEILAQMHATGGRRGDIGAGDLVITSLANARGLHHRVVCLLGMDEGRVPRARTRVGVAEWGPARVGDRDAATNDRQAWLDLLAGPAQQVAVFWSAPPQGGEAHPSVMVTDLNRMMTSLNADALPGLEKRHGALHRWSVVDHLVRPSPDKRAAELARINYECQGAGVAQDRLAGLALGPDTPVPWPDTYTLQDLVRFGLDPLHAYARHTLGIGWLGNEAEPEDVVIKADAGGLSGWAVNDQAIRTNTPTDLIVRRAIRSGLLPMAQLAGPAAQKADDLRDALARVITTNGLGAVQPVIAQVNVALPTAGGRTLRIIDRIQVAKRPDGTYVLANLAASSYKRRAMWALWVQHLVLAHAFPGQAVDVVYGFTDRKFGLLALGFGALTAEQVSTYLNQLVNTVEIGLTCPLIAPIESAMDWAKAKRPQAASIRRAWEGSSFGFDLPESALGSVVRLIGGNLPAEWVVAQQWQGQRHLDVLAQGIWAPLLAHLDPMNPDMRGR